LDLPETVEPLTAIALAPVGEQKTRMSALSSLEQVATESEMLALSPLLTDSEPSVRARTALAISRTTASIDLNRLVGFAMDDAVDEYTNELLIHHIETIVGARIVDSSSFATRGDRKKQLQSWWAQNKNSVSAKQPSSYEIPED
ncbi:MAG: hypothetical protein AAFZ58_06640, partial [Pseudomonadota bacterium]